MASTSEIFSSRLTVILSSCASSAALTLCQPSTIAMVPFSIRARGLLEIPEFLMVFRICWYSSDSLSISLCRSLQLLLIAWEGMISLVVVID